jgi:predicted 3-demethylubiquinone-9 3-methyltransferase (glyoxalase superfamily)
MPVILPPATSRGLAQGTEDGNLKELLAPTLPTELSACGEKGRCGWLKDKFGVSWQIVPPVLGEMLNDEDDEKSQRVMQAMLPMEKLDIKPLKQAYEQQ